MLWLWSHIDYPTYERSSSIVLSLFVRLLSIEYLRLLWLWIDSLILGLSCELEMWLLMFISLSYSKSCSSYILLSLEVSFTAISYNSLSFSLSWWYSSCSTPSRLEDISLISLISTYSSIIFWVELYSTLCFSYAFFCLFSLLSSILTFLLKFYSYS